VGTAGEARWRTDVAGVSLRLLAGGADAGGNLLVFHYDAPPGWAGPPLHRHPDLDEAVYILSGRLTVRLGENDHHAVPGEFAWMPRVEAHAVTNRGDDRAVFLGLITPPGRTQQFFEAVAEELAGTDGPPDPDRLMRLNAEHGMEVFGPPIGAAGDAGWCAPARPCARPPPRARSTPTPPGRSHGSPSTSRPRRARRRTSNGR
jgi:quercetin dioxygenase-like cupin family protein